MSEETKTNDDEEALEETTLLSHLIELRSRLLKIALAVVLVFIVLVPWSRDIFALVSEPLREVLPGKYISQPRLQAASTDKAQKRRRRCLLARA